MYGQGSANVRHKNQTRVRLRIAGEASFEAIVFLAIGDRLIDMLNDDRAFIPVRRLDGSTMILAKTQIISITETAVEVEEPDYVDDHQDGIQGQDYDDDDDEDYDDDEYDEDEDDEETLDDAEKEQDDVREQTRRTRAETIAAARSFDPYALLRISPEASVDEIRSAYKSRIKAVHPDSIASLGLDEDLARAALHTTQKINYAYRKIMREREQASEKEG